VDLRALARSRPSRPGHHLLGGATVVLFTDGLIEDHTHSIEDSLCALPSATANADKPPDQNTT
jgi:hypothetical protein